MPPFPDDMTGVEGSAPRSGHAGFVQALLDAGLPEPSGLVGPDGLPAPKRFNVYRNNVVASLSDAMASTFPAIQRLLGDEYFKALAREYLVVHPPKSPVLLWYGDDFADFVEGFPPLAAYPYLSDVARAEWAWAEAYHAADAPALDPAALGSVPPEELGTVLFKAHPSARLVTSKHPLADLLSANRFDPGGGGAIDLAKPQSVLMVRPDMEVMVYPLDAAGAFFLQALLNGTPLGDAAETAMASFGDLDLSGSIGAFLSWGTFTDLDHLR